MMTPTDYTTDAEYLALLRRVCENPADDAPRPPPSIPCPMLAWLMGEDSLVCHHWRSNALSHNDLGTVTRCRGVVH